MEYLSNGFYQQRLGQTGRASDKTMAAGKERYQDLLDNVFLPDNDLGEFGLNLGTTGDEAFDGFVGQRGPFGEADGAVRGPVEADQIEAFLELGTAAEGGPVVVMIDPEDRVGVQAELAADPGGQQGQRALL